MLYKRGADMRLRKRKRIKNKLRILLAVSCTGLAVFCFVARIPSAPLKSGNDIELIAAKTVLPGGSTPQSKDKSYDEDDVLKLSGKKSDSCVSEVTSSTNTESVQVDIDDTNHEGEKTYKINESQFGASGMKYDNFYVKNTTNFDLNIGEFLSQTPDVSNVTSESPKVLILHTHTTESYMDLDQGFYYESFYPRSSDDSKNVTQVGNAIAENLEKAGIGVVHDITHHDEPSYNGSYARASETIEKNLNMYPSIQVVLDIHRDAIGNNESGKVKPTFISNGKKAAQIMILAGCDTDGSLGFPDWQYNLRLALRLQQTAETMFPGITRAMSFGEFRYNMNYTHGSILIEVGTDGNTLEEAVYSGSMVGKALAEVLLKI